MILSYNWLSQYIPVTLSPEEMGKILTSVGLEVESIEPFEAVKGGLKGLVIGEVMECEQHPNADKLRLTKVNVGTENLLSIVCGAPNVAKGQKVIVATIGTTIFPIGGEPFEIKKAKIRGEESQGMLCAEDEIGLGKSHDGIIVLPNTTKVGTLARDYYNLPSGDFFYEVGLTPNRMDGMSHIGAAKDICAYLSHHKRENIQLVKPTIQELTVTSEDTIQVSVKNREACVRYTGVVIKNIEVKESPEWLKNRLQAIGLRPINNIVDITNFVLHECGQPLHAFDRKAITGNSIEVKNLSQDSKFTLLDNRIISLHEQDLMICNGDEPMCMAGIYGGLNSGVTTNTTSIFLESAFFSKEVIRKSSVRHGLKTDAAVRFEKGADMDKVLYALHRAANLIKELAGGEICSSILDVYPDPIKASEIVVSVPRLNNLVGKTYESSELKSILSSLNYNILSEDSENTFKVQVPFSNPDVTMLADIAEEIMRIDGLDNIPFTGSIQYSIPEQKAFAANYKNTIAQQLVAKGFYEIFTNSITNAAYYPEDAPTVKMINSLSANLNSMRLNMAETGLEVIAYNLNRKNTQIKLFEFGKTYKVSENGFEENAMLALYLCGQYRENYYTEVAKSVDLYYAKGIIDSLFPQLKFKYEYKENCINILYQNKAIGFIEAISENRLKQFDIKAPVWHINLDWDSIESALKNYKVSFKEIPKYPLVARDLSIVVDKSISYEQIEGAVKQAKCKLLQNTSLFDIFESDKLGADKISYALNFTFYNPSKTLTDTEIDEEISSIINSLNQKLGASLRS